MILLSILLIAQITPFVPGGDDGGTLSSGVVVINEFMASNNIIRCYIDAACVTCFS